MNWAEKQMSQNDIGDSGHVQGQQQPAGVATSYESSVPADPLLHSAIRTSMGQLYIRTKDNVEVLVELGARRTIRYDCLANDFFAKLGQNILPGPDLATTIVQPQHVHGTLGMKTTEILRSSFAVALTFWSLREVLRYREQMKLLSATRGGSQTSLILGKNLYTNLSPVG